jgi:hypothetical protein
MQGLQIGLQAILDANASRALVDGDLQNQLTESQQSQVLHVIEQQSIAVNHCFRACMAALEETTKATGHEYKYVKTYNQARVLLGDLGNVTGGYLHKYGHVDVDGSHVVAGNMAGESARDFFK